MNKERIFMVNVEDDTVSELTDIIDEMMFVESMCKEQAISYFMENLEENRFHRFPPGTPIGDILETLTN